MRRLRRRHGRARRRAAYVQPYERAAADAQSNANMTRRPWVVVFRPRTGGYHEYDQGTLRRTPISEAHNIVATFHPR